MGNFWKGVSDEKLQEAERRIFSYSGLSYDEFKITNVQIDDKGNYVRTIDIRPTTGKTDETPVVVMLHGYGASGGIFYKIVKQIVDAGIHLILVDVLGMGASSRPEFDKDLTADQADDFFVDFIEKWRIAYGDLKDFFLAGHSFGGYMCGHYAMRYP
jgi:pimeloyl-ACP methyl ester carboxylesterase